MDGLSHSINRFLEFYAAGGEPGYAADRSDVEERVVRALEALHSYHYILPSVE